MSFGVCARLARHVVLREHLQQLFASELGKAVVKNLDDLRSEALVIDGLAALVIGVIGKLVATDEVHDAWPVAVVLGQAQNNPLLILGAEDVVQRVVDLETALRVRVARTGRKSCP